MEILLSIDGIEYECVPKENKVVQKIIDEVYEIDKIDKIDKIDRILTYLNKWDNKYLLIRHILLSGGIFNAYTVAYVMDCELSEGTEVVSKLCQNSCIVKIKDCYTLTSFGKETLTREYLKDIDYE